MADTLGQFFKQPPSHEDVVDRTSVQPAPALSAPSPVPTSVQPAPPITPTQPRAAGPAIRN